jgi:ABC-type glycerol-3-phosphate transport system permease component
LVHYVAALFAYRGLAGLLNSLIVASATTVLSAVLGTCMGYSFVRFNTGGKHLALWVLSQRFLPPLAIVLPIFFGPSLLLWLLLVSACVFWTRKASLKRRVIQTGFGTAVGIR